MQGCVFKMKIIDLYDFSLYLRPKNEPGENKRMLRLGSEMRENNVKYMHRLLLDAVTLVSCTPTGKSMIDEEEENIWRLLGPIWVRQMEDGNSYRSTGFDYKVFSDYRHRTINSRPLAIAILILMSYHPMYAYQKNNANGEKLTYTSLLSDLMKILGRAEQVNVENHDKVAVIYQTPLQVLSDFLFFCVLQNTLKCLRESAGKENFGVLINNFVRNIKVYHLNFVGHFEIESSLLLSNFLDDIEGDNFEGTDWKKTRKKRYEMLSQLLMDLTLEDLEKIEGVFNELFRFNASPTLEMELKNKMINLSNFIPNLDKDRLDKELNPLKNISNYMHIVVEGDKSENILAELIAESFWV